MEDYPKQGPSGAVLDAGSKARTRSSVEGEEPRVEVCAEKKEGTTMTQANRLASLSLLRSLMKQPYGLVFSNIHIIRACGSESFKELEKPIDLETINFMLENNKYFNVEAFAEDVKTTFSNARHIFPPTEDFHKMASKLSETFEMEFKTKMESLKHESKTLHNKDVSEKKERKGSKRKSAAAAASSGREKIFIGGEETEREYDGRSVKVESPAEKWEARITALKDRFSGTIKKAEKELAAAAQAKRVAEVKEEMRRAREAPPIARMTKKMKFDRESLQNYLFT